MAKQKSLAARAAEFIGIEGPHRSVVLNQTTVAVTYFAGPKGEKAHLAIYEEPATARATRVPKVKIFALTPKRVRDLTIALEEVW